MNDDLDEETNVGDITLTFQVPDLPPNWDWSLSLRAHAPVRFTGTIFTEVDGVFVGSCSEASDLFSLFELLLNRANLARTAREKAEADANAH